MASIIQYMTTNGVPELSLMFFLILPIAATLITFARQIIGLKTFGLYIPLITTIAFLATGIRYGVFLFLIIMITGTLLRYLIKKLNLLYFPRVALTLAGITIAMYVLFLIAAYFDKIGFVKVSVFPVLILIVLSEKFIATQIRLGNKKAILMAVETLIVSIASFYLISWDALHVFALNHPLVVIGGVIIANIALGRWGGFRLTEYFRFREVIKKNK
ncbi:MAG: hypothetical protein GF387_01930 [Candidatus Portnoybacteria bacterium]|nr:hypothetical protein [Candidatus Portnoybacteria bacterium]